MSLFLLSHITTAVGRFLHSPINLKVNWGTETTLQIHWNGWTFRSAVAFLTSTVLVLSDSVTSCPVTEACGWERWDSVLWEFRFLKKHAFHQSLIQTVPNGRVKRGKKKIRVVNEVNFLIFEVSCYSQELQFGFGCAFVSFCHPTGSVLTELCFLLNLVLFVDTTNVSLLVCQLNARIMNSWNSSMKLVTSFQEHKLFIGTTNLSYNLSNTMSFSKSPLSCFPACRITQVINVFITLFVVFFLPPPWYPLAFSGGLLC